MEAALTLPLTVFLILGTLQLFLLLQARALTQYAVFHAVRTGSVKYGNCQAMTHAAIAALLPSFARTDSPSALGTAFRVHRDNTFDPQWDQGNSGSIVWIIRERPLLADIPAQEEESFDDPARYNSIADVMRLEVRLIFWYPLRIPFANWVMTRMFLAHLGMLDYDAANPLGPVQRAHWTGRTTVSLESSIRQELLDRTARKEYVFPLQASYTMRMMTPTRAREFQVQNCPPTPQGL